MADGIRIVHESGPLKGERNFGADTREISFGREVTPEDVRYPPGTTAVGGEHFSLKRAANGKYTIEVSPDYQVEVDGKPAKPGMAVRDGMLFRLGRKDGPSFRVHLDGVTKPDGYKKTETQGLFKSTRDLTIGQGNRLRAAVIGGSAIAVILAAGVFLAFRYNEDLQFALNQDDLLASAYAVMQRDDPGGSDPVYTLVGTAWPIEGGFATNAHVAEVFGKLAPPKRTLVVRPPNTDASKELVVVKVVSHPDNARFNTFAAEQKFVSFKAGEPGLEKYIYPKVYDVAKLFVAGPVPEPVLELATKEEIDALESGTQIAYAGYPVEGSTLRQGAAIIPSPPIYYGRLSLTQGFLGLPPPSGEPPQLLLADIDLNGGGSGSPAMLSNGHVFGLMSGGSTQTVLVPPDEGEDEPKVVRFPSGADMKFIQRADLLEGVRETPPDEPAGAGDEEDAPPAINPLWIEAAKRIASWPRRVAREARATDEWVGGDACAQDVRLEETRYTIPKTDPVRMEKVQIHLKVRAGPTYGFLAYADTNAMITLGIVRDDKTEKITPAMDGGRTGFPRLAYRPLQDGEITLTVRGPSTGKVAFTLYQTCGKNPIETTTAVAPEPALAPAATTPVSADATAPATPGAD